jgi:drug/metabolite transporter (DMT)-like permease
MALSTTWAALASLTTACAWAIASMMFGRLSRSMSPLALNTAKAAIAAPMLWVMAAATEMATLPAPLWVSIVASSLLGVVVADAAYLTAIQRAGAQTSSGFIPLIPVATTLLSIVFLNDGLTLRMVAGIALTLCGVWHVERKPGQTHALRGALIPLLIYVVAQASSNVINKHVLSSLPALQVSAIRLTLGALMCGAWWRVSSSRRAFVAARPMTTSIGAFLIAASFLGTCIGVGLGALGMQGLPAGVATTIVATTPLWVLVFSSLRARTWPQPSRLWGVALAVGGVFLMVT